jgi:hypothetical protein
MSEDEQMLAVGRVITEYADIRKKLAALFSEVDRHAGVLQRALWYMKPGEQYSNTDLRSSSKPPDFANFPTADQLRSLVDETLAALARKKELHDKLKEFGVEPKD